MKVMYQGAIFKAGHSRCNMTNQSKTKMRLECTLSMSIKSISNAGFVNQFRNICGSSGGRNWQRDGFGLVTRQGLVWLAQGGGLGVEGAGGRNGRGTGVGVTQVSRGQGLAPRSQGRRQGRGVKGAGE